MLGCLKVVLKKQFVKVFTYFVKQIKKTICCSNLVIVKNILNNALYLLSKFGKTCLGYPLLNLHLRTCLVTDIAWRSLRLVHVYVCLASTEMSTINHGLINYYRISYGTLADSGPQNDPHCWLYIAGANAGCAQNWLGTSWHVNCLGSDPLTCVGRMSFNRNEQIQVTCFHAQEWAHKYKQL